MTLKCSLAVAILGIWAAPALAVNPNLGYDVVGIFFEETADNNCAQPEPYTTVTAYVVSYDISRDAGLSGWEATLLINPTTFPSGITFDLGPDAVNLSEPPVFRVSLSVNRSDVIATLLTISFFYEASPVVLGIAPAIPSHFGSGGDPLQGLCPGWSAGDDPTLWHDYSPSSNVTPWTLPIYKGNNTDPNLPDTGPAYGYVVAGVDMAGPCPIATEKTTWGSVKDLYR